ncbi:MAG: glycosyltransferase family protein [Magnetococcales bacterium]|nr:glycosyltransferase family protein [Magnetococcales bacterium]
MTTPPNPEPELQAMQTLVSLFHQGRHPDLARQARSLTRRFPGNGFGWKALGLALLHLEQFAEAQQAMECAVARLPDDGEAHCNLGIILQQRQRLREAEVCLRRALTLQPGHVPAWFHLALLLKEQQRLPEAEAAYRQVAALEPDHANALDNLGNLLTGQERLPEAEAAYRQALRARPGHANARNNLGFLLSMQGRHDEAEACFRQALASQPDHLLALNNLGSLLVERRRFAAAEEVFLQALRHQPDCADAQWNLALLHLSQGGFREGWTLYESRLHPRHSRRETMNTTPFEGSFPMWRGEDLTGKTLLILPEQGFGDQVQFCRFIAVLRSRPVRSVTLVCPPALERLFRRLAGVERVLTPRPDPDYPPHDYWTFLLSLPLRLGSTLETIPATLPYLTPPAQALEAWRERLTPEGFRVGLVWRGNPGLSHDNQRSLPGLATLAPLWSVPGVVFFSLQKGPGEREARSPPPEQPLRPLGEGMRDFADTAAIIHLLDLVICVDTATAHLAGALGKPCWVLLQAWDTDWRWFHDRSDSPWYPGVMRLFRQQRPREWTPVVRRVTEALAREVGAGGRRMLTCAGLPPSAGQQGALP